MTKIGIFYKLNQKWKKFLLNLKDIIPGNVVFDNKKKLT